MNTAWLFRIKEYPKRRLNLTVKLLAAFFISITLQVSASTYAQKVTFAKKEASMKELIAVIQKQTGYSFIISSELLKIAKPVSVNLKNSSLKDALDQSFNAQPFDYIINNKTIIVVDKKKVSTFEKAKQVFQVTGKITDDKNEPLAGVAVRIKNGQGATISDAQGNYRISVPSANPILTFSFIGFENQDVVVSNRTSINVALKPQSYKLNETVVIGYGTAERGDLTGAVSSVNIEEISKAPVTTFTQALAGRIAGVQVSSSEGQPGMMQNIVIRGPGSLTQDPSPLYVVDGYALEDFDASTLNTNEIESITVLKDASSTAIYGSRAANGVIVIETKKGSQGKPKVAFNTSLGFQSVRKKIDVMSAYDFVKYQSEFDATIAKRRYFDIDRDGADEKNLESYLGATGINWQDELFKTNPLQMYDLSIRGGNADTRYSVSGSIFDQEGIILNTGSTRKQGRITIDHNLNKKLRAGVTANYSSVTNYGSQASTQANNANSNANSIFYPTFGYRPISGRDDVDLSSEDIDDLPDPNFPNEVRVNPVKQAANTYLQTVNSSLYTNAFLSYSLTKDLVFKTTGNISVLTSNRDEFFSSKTPRGLLIPANIRKVQGSVAYVNTDTWSNENTLTYNKLFNKTHRINALVGFSSQKGKTKSHGVSVMEIPNEELGMSGLDEGIPYLSLATSSNYTLASFFGRLNYSYKSKYLLTTTFRADGSSKFPTQNKWGYFPSAALAWNMHHEDFLKNIRVISNAKLRTSIGVTGNNRVSNFAYLPSLAFSLVNSYSFDNSPPSRAVIQDALGNNKLKWESTEQIDVGLDLGLFRNKLELTVDLYRKTTNDMLINADMPFATGYSSSFQNIGKLRNDGLELSLTSRNIRTKNFLWESTFNISFNKNKILAITRDQNEMFRNNLFHFRFTEALYISEVGKSAGMFYGYEWLGNYQYEDFNETSRGVYLLKDNIPTNGSARGLIQPGHIKYRDINNDGVVNESDKTTLGRSLPIHTGGFNNNLAYKGFDLNVFFQWSYGNNIYNANRLIFEGNNIEVTDLNQFASYNNRWTPENPTNANYKTRGGGPVGRNSSRVLEDGSYLRLKTVALGYNLPSAFLKKVKVSNIKLSASAQNLFTWTKYTGFDPEVAVRNSVLTPGLDYSAYPQIRSIVFGMNVSF
jgi:TonB-linked SusC/RagA family outer membrane protein